MTTVVLGLLGAGFLHLLYVTMRSKWPESYASVRTALDKAPRPSAFRYLLFRCVPTYAVGCLMAITVDRLGGNPMISLVCMGVTYGLGNDGRALWRLRSGGAERGPVLWFYYVFNLLLVAGIVALSCLTYSWYTDFVPEPDELVFAVWTAVFAAVLATAFQQLLRFPSLSTEQKLKTARQDIGEDTWAHIEEAAVAANCDPMLMRAIVAAEALQRPRWMRNLERVKGRIIPEGSYGVAQMTAPRPLSDNQSVDALCLEHAGYYPTRRSGGDVRESLLEARIERHNCNPEFVASVMEFYRHQTPWAMDRSSFVSYDGRSHIEVTAVKRVGDQFEIEGTAVMADSQLYVGLIEGGEVRELVPVPTHAGDERRQEWTAQIPLEATQVAFYKCSGAGLDEIDDAVAVDLEYR